MAAPFVVACSHCGAKLKLKDDSAAGKKVRCPKCQEVFVAAASGVGKSKPPAARKSAKPKDDFDFGDISEEDYTPPPGAEGESDDFDDLPAAPAAKRTTAAKSGGKKKKKRASDGPGFGKLALIGALVLLGIGMVGGVGFGVYSFIQNMSGGAGRFAWLPEDADYVIEIDVADAWNSGVIQPLRNGEIGKALGEKMQGETKTNPGDIDRIVVGGKGGGERPVVVIYSGKPIDRADATKNGTVSEYNGNQLYSMPSQGAMFFPDDNTAVAGPKDQIRAAIDRQGAFSAVDRFSELPSSGQIRFAATNISAAVSKLPQIQQTPGFDPQQMQSVAGSVSLAKDIGAEFTCVCRDAATAQSLQHSIEKDKADGLAKLAEQRMQMEANPVLKFTPMRNLLSGAEKALESYQVTSSGSSVTTRITVPGKLIEDAVEAAGPMFASMLNSLPSPGGPGSFATPAGDFGGGEVEFNGSEGDFTSPGLEPQPAETPAPEPTEMQ